MSLYEDLKEMNNTIDRVAARVENLEKGTQKGADGTVKRVARERMQEEREDRKEAMRAKNYARGKWTGAHPVDKDRREESERRYNELRAPHPTPRPTPTQTEGGVGGNPVKWYMFKEGKFGSMDVLVQGGFTEYKP